MDNLDLVLVCYAITLILMSVLVIVSREALLNKLKDLRDEEYD
tara:strand:+ start:823 stop:951 length:129 start_codon:yes stop_codon:yes gene_type:complete